MTTYPEMPLPLRTDVFIVESQSATDFLDRRTEGAALSEALRLAGIPSNYLQVINRASLDEALDRILKIWHPDREIETYGNDSGKVWTLRRSRLPKLGR